jgi:hypothetical protein
MARWMGGAGMALLAASSLGAGGEPAPSHCAPGEQVVLSCAMEGSAKVLSLCASAGATAGRGYLQYRFGKVGAVELQYPSDRSVPPGRAFVYTVILQPPGGFSSYAFTLEGNRYAVFSSSHAGDETAGVTVTPKGGREVSLACAATTYGTSKPALPNQAVLALKAAARATLASLERSASCGGEAREHWRQTAEQALELEDTDALLGSLHEDLQGELEAMTCP